MKPWVFVVARAVLFNSLRVTTIFTVCTVSYAGQDLRGERCRAQGEASSASEIHRLHRVWFVLVHFDCCLLFVVLLLCAVNLLLCFVCHCVSMLRYSVEYGSCASPAVGPWPQNVARQRFISKSVGIVWSVLVLNCNCTLMCWVTPDRMSMLMWMCPVVVVAAVVVAVHLVVVVVVVVVWLPPPPLLRSFACCHRFRACCCFCCCHQCCHSRLQSGQNIRLESFIVVAMQSSAAPRRPENSR